MAASNPSVKTRLFGNELKYVQEVLASDFRTSKGAGMMGRLEGAFAKKFGSPFAISFVNGTATMHAILEAIGLNEGDEVIVPPLTMSSTCFCVLQANATPVFADVDPETFCIDPRSIEARITSKTKAIITVALYGQSPDMDPIMDLAKKHNLFVLEDNAEAFLSYYKGRMVGTIGHASSFSFQSSKHMTAGEGGMVLCNSEELANNIRRVSSLGYAGVSASKGKITRKDIQDPTYSRHVTMGWNYRMPELCAAVALGQLENLEHLVERRTSSAKLFAEAVSDCAWMVPQKTPSDYVNSYWTFVARNEHPKMTWYAFRDKFMEAGGDGIYAAWKINYLEPAFLERNFLKRQKFITKENLDKYAPGNCPIAEALQKKLFQFKTNYWNPEDAVRQAEILRKVVRSF